MPVPGQQARRGLRHGRVAAAVLTGVLMTPLAAGGEGSKKMNQHEKDVEAWRQQRVAKLKSDDGWLTITGLFWLEPGKNRLGSAADNTVDLPAHSAPAHAGVLELSNNQVTLIAAPGAAMTVAGKPVSQQALRSDVPGPADVVNLGDLRFFVIERDGRLAVRLRDLRSPRRDKFNGIETFPVRPEFRINAQFVPHPPGSQTGIPITNVLGKVSEMKSPGKLVFTLGGETLSLDAVQESPTDTRLFILFRDSTAGKETYGAGRFLYSDGLPKDGHVIVDFNKAYNPPCALTPFATCPLPPPQNRLRVRIEAGEKNVPDPH